MYYHSKIDLPLGEIEESEESDNRPQLLDSSLHVREAQILNHRFEYAQATLDFDQKIYLNEPLMCPFGEYGCQASLSGCANCSWENVQVGFFF